MKSVMVQSLNSSLARTAKVRGGHSIPLVSMNVECEGSILVTKAVMAQDSDYNALSRPYLKLIGEVQSITGQFPYDVAEVTYDSRHKPFVEYRYELTNEELADLCTKGLFDDGFKTPDIFENNEFILPLNCSVVSVEPTDEDEAPLLFVSVNDPYNLTTDTKSSGYDITEYFEKQKLSRKVEMKYEAAPELSEEEKQEFAETELDTQAETAEPVPVEEQEALDEPDVSETEDAVEDHVSEDEVSEDATEPNEEEISEKDELDQMFQQVVESSGTAIPTAKPVPDAPDDAHNINEESYDY